MPRTNAWRCTWRTGADAVADAPLWAAWELTRSRAPLAHVFHRPAVLRAWYETVARADEIEPAIAECVSPQGVCVRLAAAITPYRGRFVGRAVCEPAGRELFGYQDPLADAPLDRFAWDGFWQAVKSSLGDRCDAGLFRFVHEEFAGVDLREPAGDESPVLHFDGARTLDDLLARCSANHRGDLRRRIRRLNEQGSVELRIFTASEADAAVAEFTALFYPSWLERWAPASRAGLDAFCMRVINDGIREGWGHYAALLVGGVPIAWHLGLSDGGRLYWWMPAHAEPWDGFSPGKVLLALLIERLMQSGWRELHFQTGSQPYKLAWRPAQPPLSAIRWHAPSLKGRLLAGYDLMAKAR